MPSHDVQVTLKFHNSEVSLRSKLTRGWRRFLEAGKLIPHHQLQVPGEPAR